MKVLIITCYESNEERVSFVLDACKKRGYEVSVITSDYSHIRKEKRNNIPEGYEAVNARPYSKNMSLQRMLSHKQFAEDAFMLAEKHDPDLIWLMAPANSLIKEAKQYKERHDVKIIIDIIDMWPESLPVAFNKNLLPFRLWRDIRSRNISCADALVTECDLYQDILSREYKKDIRTIYWARENRKTDRELKLPEDRLSLCYIGSINNIIDIDRICALVESSDKKVVFHLIGEGEKTDEMKDRLDKICEVEFHGAVRDATKKDEIFKRCHAGINIYKEGLYIGLTVKCIDYLEHGMPLINNIKGDTWNFVAENDVGINIEKDSKLKSQKLIDMRCSDQNIYDFFENNFTREVFEKKCLEVIDEVIK